MNIPVLLEIVSWLVGGAKHTEVSFNMSTGIRLTEKAFDAKTPSTCGATCCIAGAAVQFVASDWLKELINDELEHGSIAPDNRELPFQGCYGIFNKAQDVLQLTYMQATELFTPGGRYSSYKEYNDPDWAARTICYLIATGEANWDATKENA